MRRKFIILLLLIPFCNTNAQSSIENIAEDSIKTIDISEQNIQNREQLGLLNETRKELIEKCLMHLTEAIAYNDKEMVYKLKEYAIILEDSIYLPLRPTELFLIDIYLNNFNDFLTDIVKLDSIRENNIQKKLVFNSGVFAQIYNKVAPNINTIKELIHSDNNLNQTDKDFFDLYVKQIETHSANYTSIIDKAAKTFLEQHPNCLYNYYVRKNLLYRFKKSFDLMQLDVDMGVGICVLAGNITDWFEEYKCTFNGGIAIGLMHFELSWNFNGIINNSPKKDIHFSDEVSWEKEKKWNALTHQFCIGRYIPFSEKWVFIPRIGIGYTEFLAPYDHDNEDNPLNDKKLTSIMPCIGGEIRYEKVFQDNITVYWGPTLRLSIQPIKTKIEGHTTYGSITTLSITFKIGMCDSERIN